MLLKPSNTLGSALDPALQNVPVELYREIVTQLHPGDDIGSLKSLCLVSQSLRNEAERRMYSRLSASQPKEVALLCELLAREPRLASLVGELTIVTTDVPRVELDDVGVAALIDTRADIEGPALDLWDERDFHTARGALRYWRTVARALRALPNLHTLTLAGDRALGLAWVLAGTTFRLRRFCGYMAFDAFLLRFLHEQSASLSDLELLADGTYTGEPILAPLNHVSIMRVCLLDLEMATTLICGRPVTHLQVTTAALHDAEIGEIAKEWRGSTGPVKAFTVDFGDDYVSNETMKAISEGFGRTLRFLGVVPLVMEDVEIFLPTIAKDELPCLRTLIINNREHHSEIPADCQFELAGRIRAINPHILTIGYARISDDGALVADCYRWVPSPTSTQQPHPQQHSRAGKRNGHWEFVIGEDVEEMWAAAGSGELN